MWMRVKKKKKKIKMRTAKQIKKKLKEFLDVRVQHTRRTLDANLVKRLNLVIDVLKYCLGESDDLWV